MVAGRWSSSSPGGPGNVLPTPHSVWLDGPNSSARQVGVKGVAYQPLAMDPELAHPPLPYHVVILYLRTQTRIARRLGKVEEVELVKPGQVAVHPAAVPSFWSWSDPIEVLHLHVDPAAMRAVAREAYGRDPGALCLLHPLCVEDATLNALGNELMAELGQPSRLGIQVAIRAIGMRVMLHLLRNYVRTCQVSRHEEVLQELASYIHAHLGDDLPLEHLAKQAGLGRRQFFQAFQETFGVSPKLYIREQRLQLAQQLLCGSDLSIGEVAFRSGFADQSHLTRTFSKHYGVSPGRYRISTRSVVTKARR